MKSPIRILAVDGGGVGGIIPARVLERLQAHYPDLVERADLVAGTSTGGLIALGLAAGQNPAQLCSLYQEHAKDIFSRANRRSLLCRLWRAKFTADGLRDAVLAIVGDQTLGQLTAKPVLVPVTALKRADSRHRPAGISLSTVYRLSVTPTAAGREKYQSSQWKCVDVALATATAPTFFPAHEVEKAPGPPPANGSAGTAGWWPTTRPWPPSARSCDWTRPTRRARTRPRQPPDIRVLSLGTGYRNLDVEARGLGPASSQPAPIAWAPWWRRTRSGSTSFLLGQLLGRKVIRVSPKLDEDYGIDDPAAVDRLNAAAVAFIDKALGTGQAEGESTARLPEWLDKHWFDPDPVPA